MMAPVLSVEEAQARVMAEVELLGSEEVPFEQSEGRVLRESVVAPRDAPEADNSAMDGYAVRAEDIATVPARLRVTGTIAAGHLPGSRVEPRTALRIMTGAYVPEGTDTVVQIELTDGGVEEVTINEAVSRGANIRRRGEDVRAGTVVLESGTRIGAAEMALLAAVQKDPVTVGRRPTVAILSTGDELIDAREPHEFGKIVNTNAPLLAALVRDAGAIAQPLGIVRDTREATIGALRSAMPADFILTSGGVSVGAFDFVKEALEALGAETKFWQVAMKPGKPVFFSRLRKSLCFGLPGNPASCFVSFHLFVAPALRKAAGQTSDWFAPEIEVTTSAPLRGLPRRVYTRARLIARAGELIAEPLVSQGSGSLTSMRAANALVVLEPGVRVDAGARVRALVIGPISSA